MITPSSFAFQRLNEINRALLIHYPRYLTQIIIRNYPWLPMENYTIIYLRMLLMKEYFVKLL